MRRGAPTLVILTLFLLASHGIGSFFSLYGAFWWFDMALHTLGGAWLASIFITLGPLRYPSYFALTSLNHATGVIGRNYWIISSPLLRYVLRIIFLVLIAGTLWELYEYGFAVWATSRFGDLGFSQPPIDTLTDLVLDVLGAAVITLFLLRKKREIS